MRPFESFAGVAAHLPQANVDTDQILPARFLKTVTRAGLAQGLFADLRADPAFVLNRAPWNRAEILVAGANFGCGSSREHAPWALLDFGIRCVVAPGFADIFAINCLKNGLLAVTLDPGAVARLLREVAVAATSALAVDLPGQTVTASSGEVHRFWIDPATKRRLAEGADDVARTAGHEAAIAAHEHRRRRERPWLCAPTVPPEARLWTAPELEGG